LTGHNASATLVLYKKQFKRLENKKMKKQNKLFTRALSVAILVAVLALQSFPFTIAYAAQITDRSLTLQAGGTDGGSKPGGVVKHLFTFTLPSSSTVGSIQFKYCTLAAGVCTTPTGLVTTAATLANETGATGFTMVNTTNGIPYLTRTASAASGIVSYQLATITNPTTTNQTFYVRISTYASIDTSGGSTDAGTVAASTATQIVIDGTMPESLVFCTGATVGLTTGVPDCATATAGAISFNQLFSPTDTASTTSQMAASTNAGSGYVISVNGPTLTSGSNTISAMGTTAAGIRGISQFGLNLKANTVTTSTPAVGTEIASASNGTNYRGQATANYGTVDEFKFTTGDPVANSAFNSAGGTDAQIYTVSYIVNVPGSQPAGTYTTTLTYICTPTF
jgi:hypothetical protein